jgi:peptide/nickel transport system substrate-binding protein
VNQDALSESAADRGITRRSALRLIGFGAGALTLAACTSAPSAPAANNSQASTPQSAGAAGKPASAGDQPKQGGTLKVYADPGFSVFWDPHAQASTNSTSDHTNSLIYEGLTEQQPDGKVAPSLAESWTISPDGKTYTFKMRQGVKFHNGRAMTSADVVYSFQRIKDPATGTANRSQFDVISEIQAPDPATVVITLQQAYAPFLAILTDNRASIVPQEEVLKGNLDRSPVGTGPFKFGAVAVNQSLNLDANRDYWRPNVPHLDRMTMLVPPDADAAVLGLKAGDVDLLRDVGGSHFQELKNDSRFNIYTGDSTTLAWLFLNPNNNPAFKDPRVTQAIAWAVDRKAIADLVLPGLATPQLGGFLPASYWAGLKQPLYPAPDGAKAKQLLTEAGVGSGFQFTLMIGTPSGSTAHLGQAGQVIQQQLKPLGIDVTLQAVESTQLTSEWTKGTFQATLWGSAGTPDPDQQFYFMFMPGAQRNFAKFQDDQMEQAVVQARTVTEPAKRAQLYQEAQTRLAQNSTFVFLYNYNKFDAAYGKVKGVVYNPQTKQWREARDFWLDA